MIRRLLIHQCSLHFINGLNKTITIFVFTMQQCFHSTTARINAIDLHLVVFETLETHACIYQSSVVCGVAFCILDKVPPLRRPWGMLPPSPVSALQIAELLLAACLFLTYDSTELCIRFIRMCVQGARKLRTQFV